MKSGQGVLRRQIGHGPMKARRVRACTTAPLTAHHVLSTHTLNSTHTSCLCLHRPLSLRASPTTELHSERVQGLLFGDIGRVETEKELEHHLLEEELTLQLQLLQDEMPPTTLFADIAKDFKMFPEVEDKMPELPHLKDGTTAALARKSIQEHQNQFWFDKMMEEGIVESLAFCALIAMAWAIPNMVLN